MNVIFVFLVNFSRGLINGLDLAAGFTKKHFIPDDVIDKYREALSHYSKVSVI